MIRDELVGLAEDYKNSIKNLLNTLMTTANVPAFKKKPDIEKAKLILKEIKKLDAICKKDAESDMSDAVDQILENAKYLDLYLQKIGVFENIAVEKSREQAIEKSNHMIALLMKINGSGAEEDIQEDDDLSEDEDDENE